MKLRCIIFIKFDPRCKLDAHRGLSRRNSTPSTDDLTSAETQAGAAVVETCAGDDWVVEENGELQVGVVVGFHIASGLNAIQDLQSVKM